MLICSKKKKKKACPFWILLVLTFYFLSLLKQHACLLTSEICSPGCEALQEGCSDVCSQQMCGPCSHCALGWSSTCAGHKPEAQEWVNEIKCIEILYLASNTAVWSSCSFSELFRTFLFSKNLFRKVIALLGR